MRRLITMVISISLVPKLIASEGEFTVRFGAGWVIMVVSRGGWVLMVRVEEGQVVVVVVVVECRGRMVPIRIIRSAGTATVIIPVAIRRVGEVSRAFVNFLIVTIDGFPMVEYQVLLVVVKVRGGWVVVVVIVKMIRAMGTATVIIGVQGSNLRFEFGHYLNLNLLRGSGSGILPNLIPEPQVRNQVWTGFGRFGNWTVASLIELHFWL